jgi:hypothetical protein
MKSPNCNLVSLVAALVVLIGSVAAPRALAQSAAVTDTVSVTAGTTGNCVNSSCYTGYISGTIGSVSTVTSDGHPYLRISDNYLNCGKRGGCTPGVTFSIGGLTQDPSAQWLFSVTANGQTRLASCASYSFSNGTAAWSWTGGTIGSCVEYTFGLVSGKTYTVSVGHNLVGYVNPKFYVVGVTYAPPGPSANTFVNYTNSNLVGTTTTLSQSYASGVTNSVSLSKGFTVAAAHGSVTANYSTTASLTTKNSSSITSSFQVQSGEKTFGTGNYFAPVNNDYDMIWVWLNPAVIMTVGNKIVTWTGLGYDTTDQNGLDIVGVELGYLNGDFGPLPADIQASFNRAWAASQIWGAGDGPALTSADLAQIAAADPFSVNTYGTSIIGYTPPSETSDHRFTLSACSSTGSFDYVQAAPSQSPAVYACTLTYTNGSTQSQQITQSFSQTFSVDVALGGSFLASVDVDFKTSQTFTWTTDAQSSISSTTTSTAALSVQGPPCNNVNPGVGPCVPVYDSGGNQPTEFEVYQDNMYGTFMFAPVHFY